MFCHDPLFEKWFAFTYSFKCFYDLIVFLLPMFLWSHIFPFHQITLIMPCLVKKFCSLNSLQRKKLFVFLSKSLLIRSESSAARICFKMWRCRICRVPQPKTRAGVKKAFPSNRNFNLQERLLKNSEMNWFFVQRNSMLKNYLVLKILPVQRNSMLKNYSVLKILSTWIAVFKKDSSRY